jgi:hypothetical protein
VECTRGRVASRQSSYASGVGPSPDEGSADVAAGRDNDPNPGYFSFFRVILLTVGSQA